VVVNNINIGYYIYMRYHNQKGGGKCSLCGSPGTVKTNCPLNPNAPNPDYAKHPLAANVSAGPRPIPRPRAIPGAIPIARPRPIARPVQVSEPIRKMVTTKSAGTAMRIAAGAYYRKHPEAVGNICDIRDDGDLRCLLLNKNGVARWAKVSKSGAGQEVCGTPPWIANCRE
jgi:hypothetical protein